MLWRIVYEDGDEEDFTFAHMIAGIRNFRALAKQRQIEGTAACTKRRLTSTSSKRRASHAGVERPPRRPQEPAQALFPFPVVVSPTDLALTNSNVKHAMATRRELLERSANVVFSAAQPKIKVQRRGHALCSERHGKVASKFHSSISSKNSATDFDTALKNYGYSCLGRTRR